jgi:hypothetical protein
MPDDITPTELARRSSEVSRYDPSAARGPVSALARLWRALIHSRRRNRRAAPPRCQHCGYLIAQAAASPTGWTHALHWNGLRCPGGASEAEPSVRRMAGGR